MRAPVDVTPEELELAGEVETDEERMARLMRSSHGRFVERIRERDRRRVNAENER